MMAGPIEKLRDHGRYAYSPVTERADFDWPDGRRLAIYIGLNIEVFSFGEGVGATLDGASPEPDVQNHSWWDYGNRVGVWRMIDLFDRLDLPVTLLPNSAVIDKAPQIIDAFRRRGDEIAAHGITNSQAQGQLPEEQERALIEKATRAITDHVGTAPKGWLGPWISQSAVTPDLLKEAGYLYHLDWCHDDQPVWMQTRAGPILSIPYPQELNDIPQMVGRHHEGADFAEMIRAAFAVHRRECERRPAVMGIALHPYLVGQPHRFHHLEKVLTELKEMAGPQCWFTTAGAIADHYARIRPADEAR